jgi:hypothetical protein
MKGLYGNVNKSSVYLNRQGSSLVAERLCSMNNNNNNNNNTVIIVII